MKYFDESMFFYTESQRQKRYTTMPTGEFDPGRYIQVKPAWVQHNLKKIAKPKVFLWSDYFLFYRPVQEKNLIIALLEKFLFEQRPVVFYNMFTQQYCSLTESNFHR